MVDDKSPVVIGCDHAAFELKEKLKQFLTAHGFTVKDVGTFSEASVDYPDFGARVAALVSSGQYRRGILMCGTGIGMSMVANRFPNVRAALCNDLFAAIMSRRHNDANLLVMGARVIGETLAQEITRTWFATPYEGGRHQNRLTKFSSVEQAQRLTDESVPEG